MRLELVDLGHRAHQRLLAEHVLAGPQHRLDLRAVEVRRRAQVHDVDVVVGQHRVEVGGGPHAAQPAGHLGGPLAVEVAHRARPGRWRTSLNASTWARPMPSPTTATRMGWLSSIPRVYRVCGASPRGKVARMADELNGKTIAFLATEGVEQVELTEPWKAVEQAGGTPKLVSPDGEEVQGFNHLDKADTFPADHAPATSRPATSTGWCCPAASPTPTRCAWTTTRWPSSRASARRTSRSR